MMSLLRLIGVAPTSRVALIINNEVFETDMVKGTEWRCGVPANSLVTLRIRKAITPPYYKSFDKEVYVPAEGLDVIIEQEEDY